MAGQADVTVDFGSSFVTEKEFTVTDANITTASVIECFVQGDSTVDNDTNAHVYAARSLRFCATPASGSFTLNVSCHIGMCSGTFKIRYAYV